MSERTESPFETAVVDAFPYLVAGLVLSLPLLALPVSDEPLWVFTLHLSALVILGLLVAFRVGPLAGADWFRGRTWERQRRRLAGIVVLVMIVTGVVALVTMASAAVLRFDPSLQFLQLLSALDIAWVTAALYLGVRWWLGEGASRVAAATLGAVCVVSVWNYLRVVGFGPGGEWVVDGDQLLRLVLPFDVAAAVLAVGSVILGLRRTG